MKTTTYHTNFFTKMGPLRACSLLLALLPLLGQPLVLKAQIITTVAGEGAYGYGGDGGLATTARLSYPRGVAADATGGILIADTDNSRIRRVAPDGTITTVAGNGLPDFSGDGGPATTASLKRPSGVAVDATGGILIADRVNHRIRRVAPDGTITTVAGNGIDGFSGDGGPAIAASLSTPNEVAVDATGGILIADFGNSRIRRVAPDGTITTVAGNGTYVFAGDGGPATETGVGTPRGVAVDATGGILIADSNNDRIRRVAPDGTITTVAGGTFGYAGDGGPATAASLFAPEGVAVDASGGILIADTFNNRIRRVATPPAAARLYVKADAAGNNTGLDWNNAFTDLQSALNYPSAQNLTEIWVAQGIYKPTSGTDRSISFAMKNGVALYGGFTGNETELSQRPSVNPLTGSPSSTTLSGDIGNSGDNADNSYHVINNSGLNNSAVLDGFVVSGGNANGTFPNYQGGGMYNTGSSPTLTNCLFQSNSFNYQGGAIYNTGSSPVLTNCSFQNNSSGFTSSQGGAIYNNSSNPALTNCLFQGNSVYVQGGAIFNDSSSPVLTNCSFQNNTAGTVSGQPAGGAIYNSGSSPSLTNCSFQGNRAGSGWAIYNYFYSSTTLTNCVLWDNGGSNTFGNILNSNLTVSYSLFESGVNPAGSNNLTTSFSPFVSTSSTQLIPCAPAINAGDPGSLTSAAGPYSSTNLPQTDLGGAPRIVGGRVDMGAYEFQGSPQLPLTITSQPPASSAVCQGSAVSVSVSVSGDVSGYQWYKDGQPISGQTSATLTLASAQPSDAGSYALVATSSCNTLTSTDFVLTVSTDPCRLYVDASKTTGNNTGLSWADAFPDLQSALNYSPSSSLTEIWVAQGGYKPTSGTNRGISFALKNGVAVYGGFVGNETDLSQRPPGSSSTLSGDIGTVGDNSDNSYHVIYNGSGLNNSTRLDGFVITGGNANSGYPNSLGGGLFIDGGSSPTLVNCRLVANNAGFGGAYFGGNSSPVLINCGIENNTSSGNGGGFNFNGGRPLLVNCSFQNNLAGGQGGAMNLENGSSPRLTNCVVFGNGGSNTFSGGTVSAGYSLFETSVTNYGNGDNNLTTAVSPFISTSSTQLNSCAAAINTGSNQAYTDANGPATDLAGNPRIFPTGGLIDMGAYEFQGATSSPVSITQQPPAGSALCAGSPLSVSVSVTGPVNAYQWYKDGQPLDGQTSATLSLSDVQSSDAGSYTVRVTSSCNSVTSEAYVLTVKPQPTASISGNGGAICAGSDASFSVSGTSGATLTYTITGQSGNQTILLNGSSQTITASGATSNVTLTLVSVSLDGCSQNLSGSSTVTVNPLPTAAISGNGGAVCAGGDASFTVSGTSAAILTYTLTGQSGNQILVLEGTNQTITARGATSDVTLTLVSVEFLGCINNLSGSSKVTVKPQPTASIAGNGGAVCSGGTASFTVSGTSGSTLTYTITGESGSQTLLLDGTSQTITASGATSDVTLTLVSVSLDGCTQSLSGSSTVTVKPQPTASISGNGGAICAGGDASFTLSGTSGAMLTYTITGQNGNQTLLLNGSSQTITTSGATSNVTLTLVSVSLDGCTQNLSGNSTVTVNPLPLLMTGPDQSVVLGYGSNCTQITATASGGSGGNYVYVWTPGNLSGRTVTVCPEVTTTYTVRATDGNGCTSAEAHVTVNVQDVRCGNKNQNVTICYYGVTQCVSEKIATRYLKLGAMLGGCGSSASRIGVQETTDAPLTLSLKAYPNPVQDAVTVQVLSPAAGRGTFKVLDMNGVTRQTRTEHLSEGLNQVGLRLGTLPTGVYLIHCADAVGRQATVRVSKE